MLNSFRRSAIVAAGTLLPAVLLCLFGLTAPRAIAQATPAPTALDKQLSRVDLGISATGFISSKVSGTNYLHVALTDKPSSTVGTLVTIRYTVRPYEGFEFNYDHARLSENFQSTPEYVIGGAQTGQDELTLGYVAHPRTFFGIQPYLGAGGGTIHFKPTPYGGQGLPTQFRAVYYYNAGLEDNFPSSHFGVRLGFRQLIYLAPDFGQNYLTITRRTRTSEPTIGFFVRF